MLRRNFIKGIAGSAAAWPFEARAQQPVKTHLLAILTHIDAVDRTTGQQARYWTAFFNQLRDLGYEEAAIWP